MGRVTLNGGNVYFFRLINQKLIEEMKRVIGKKTNIRATEEMYNCNLTLKRGNHKNGPWQISLSTGKLRRNV